MLEGKPLICVSAELRTMAEDARRRISELHQTYTEAVFRAGGIPLPTCALCADELAQLCDGLVLSGGADIAPERYGEAVLNDTVQPQPERDAFELTLLRAFMRQDKPILGICRGSQVINVALGGTLYQDLAQQRQLQHQDVAMRHSVAAVEGSVLHELFDARFLVNSTHHQAVKTLGRDLWATAYADDGTIEAFEHRSKPILAAQFHPERLTGRLWDARTPDFLPFFAHFIRLCTGDEERSCER